MTVLIIIAIVAIAIYAIPSNSKRPSYPKQSGNHHNSEQAEEELGGYDNETDDPFFEEYGMSREEYEREEDEENEN